MKLVNILRAFSLGLFLGAGIGVIINYVSGEGATSQDWTYLAITTTVYLLLREIPEEKK